MVERCAKYEVEIWAYCLMPNHIHLIADHPAQNCQCALIYRAIGDYFRQTFQAEKAWPKGK